MRKTTLHKLHKLHPALTETLRLSGLRKGPPTEDDRPPPTTRGPEPRIHPGQLSFDDLNTTNERRTAA